MNKRFKNFLIMGSISVVLAGLSLPIVSAASSQDDLYDDLITRPLEQKFNLKDPIKSKYQSYIEKDKQFLVSLKFPQDITDIRVILKHHEPRDDLFYPFMTLGTHLFNFDEETSQETKRKYLGAESQYRAYFFPDGSIDNEYVMLGLNALEDRKDPVYKKLYEVFQDEEKMTSFVFFHEIGHKISQQLGQENKQLSHIFEIYEKKGGLLSLEEKQFITELYSENFADNFALSMMVKRYPDLTFETTASLLTQVRSLENDNVHTGRFWTTRANHSYKVEDIVERCQSSGFNAALLGRANQLLDKTEILNNISKTRKKSSPSLGYKNI